MVGATVTAYSVSTVNGSNIAVLGGALTGGMGNFTITLAKAPSGPVRITASGGTFVSEADGDTISFPSDVSALLASVTKSTSGLSVNPLSDFVNSLTVGKVTHGTAFAAALASARAAVESDYGLTADPSTIVPDYTLAGVGGSAGNLGLALGALIQEDEILCARNPGGLTAALSADISDGVFDGLRFGSPIIYCGGTLDAFTGIAEFEDALSGLQQFHLINHAFAFGGKTNVLTINGVANRANGGKETYPLAPLAVIEEGLGHAAPAPVNSFAAAATMNTARTGATATLLVNGKVLVAGGFTGTVSLASTELYTPATNKFAPASGTPSMNTARRDAVAVLLRNGRVLIAGGCCDSKGNVLNSTELYDPANNTFAAVAKTALMNAGRRAATATLLPNGKVLVAGGANATFTTFLTSTELYDPAKNTFAPVSGIATMNNARARAAAALLPNGDVLIAGGIGTGGVLATTEHYNLSGNNFAPSTKTHSMNTARQEATATLLPNGKVLIAGGANSNSSVFFVSTELYDTANNSFAKPASTSRMSVARALAAATLLPNGKVIIGGGIGTGGALLSTELYDPTVNLFAPPLKTAAMKVARALATATLLPNGKVLIAGGQGSTAKPLASTELYTP